MRESIRRVFAPGRPRALVLDDNANARKMMARRLHRLGFDVVECRTVEEFSDTWSPGTFDVIVADWQLSGDTSKLGDRILLDVRRRDWDVPFVLVSGKLDEDTERVGVLTSLLESGGARFVERGAGGIKHACEEAEDLIERRDLALVKVVLSLRRAVLANATVRTTSGEQSIQELLEEVVSRPRKSHDAERPVADRLAAQTVGKR